MHRILVAVALLIATSYANAQFVQDQDLISLHYDHAPDRDDGHATVSALAIVRSFGIVPHVVSGAYGVGNRAGYIPAAETVMQQTWGSAWVNAHANWSNAVNTTATRWLATLQNGGDVWVAEGGQSDFTADVVRRIKNSNPGINTRNRIHVVQHSFLNEANSDQNDLEYSKNNTDYTKIKDGNHENDTADLNEKSANFVALARASEFGTAWDAAFNYLNPNSKLDFSDTVELLYILGIGKNQIATVDDFAAMFLEPAPIQTASSPTVWSDSYSVDGQCYCDSTYDHGLATTTVTTPAGQRTVPQICDAITSTHGVGSFQNRVYYNTVQCGHQPANNAADEAVCPGIPRATGDYTGSRCNNTGATWNLSTVFAAPEQTPEDIEDETLAEAEPQAQVDIDFPACSSNVTDFDGDGYGWENNQTCVITSGNSTGGNSTTDQSVAPIDNPLINFPVCSTGIADNGAGYGWENNQTCVIQVGSSSVTTPVADQSVADNPLINFPVCSTGIADNGAGYGWENNQTCVMQTGAAIAPIDNPLINFPVCSAGIADNGAGYGWENNQTCVIQVGSSSVTTTVADQSVAPVDNPLINFPVCSAGIADNGAGYGWENNQTCVIQVGSSSVTTTVADQSVAPVDNPLINFPVCSAGIADNGAGYGWENNQTCVIQIGAAIAPIDNPLINFPVCSAGIANNGAGYGWENNQTCVIQTGAATATTDNPLVDFPVCSEGIVDNGAGYGWENNQTCVIRTGAAIAPIDNPLINFPVCSAGIANNGAGYGWENNQTCVIQTSTTVTPTLTTPTTDQTVAPIDNPLVFFPVCSAGIIDDNGDGYGWDNFQTCVIDPNL